MTNDIIKLLDFEDANIEVQGLVSQSGKRILTLRKKALTNYCPVCSHIMHSRGIYTRTVNHPVMQDGKQLVIRLNQRRYKCTNPVCGRTQNDEFSFINPYRRNTNVTDLLIVSAFKDPQMTACQIAKMLDISDTQAITTFARYVDMPARQLTEAICIDEVHVDISQQCKYALVIQDFVSGEPIDMLPSRRKDITEPYFAGIPIKQRRLVQYLVTDMYRPYLKFVDQYFPNAVHVVDSFHVVKMINGHLHKYLLRLIRKYRELDELRHDALEQELGRRIEFTPSKEYYLLKKYEWLILKNNDDVKYSGQSKYNRKLRRYATIGEIESMIFDIDPNLKELRDLKEKYIRFNRQYGGKHKAAKAKLGEIIQKYEDCPYDMFHKIAESLRYHFDRIVNSFIMVQRHCKGDTYIKRLSNGPVEGLNRIVKDMKRDGRGYGNFEHLRNRFLYSQRANASILGTPKSLEEACPKTGIKRGSYAKHTSEKKKITVSNIRKGEPNK